METPVVTVFGSSKISESQAAYEKARALGAALANQGFTVCNGGYGGVMEASARGAKEAGGKTIGVTISGVSRIVNAWIDEERKTLDWQSRLFGLIEAGDAYVFLDGATGTLTELFVVWEMTNHNLIEKSFVLYGDFIRNLARDLRRRQEFFFNPHLQFADNLDTVLDILKRAFMPPSARPEL